jgi:hypothetical protein
MLRTQDIHEDDSKGIWRQRCFHIQNRKRRDLEACMTDEPEKTDKLLTVREVSSIPIISAEAYQHVGRYAGGVVMSVFEQLGGVNRMAAWADSNYTDFATKLFPKMISRSQQIDVSGTLTIDDAISRLERMGDVIEADYEEIPQSFDL